MSNVPRWAFYVGGGVLGLIALCCCGLYFYGASLPDEEPEPTVAVTPPTLAPTETPPPAPPTEAPEEIAPTEPTEAPEPELELPTEALEPEPPPTLQPTETPVPSPTTPGISPEERAYFQRMAEATGAIGTALGELAELTSNPTGTDDWVIDVAVQLVAIQQAHEQVRRVEVPPGLEYMHVTLQQGTEACDQMTRTFSSAVDNNDTALLQQSMEELQTCQDKLNDAHGILDEWEARQ